ncbi:MAG: hypothetical protein L6R37_001131 [Teloschistes peruensis]|nr:MAG: hypothetical protein L6R37_001131 [Teloschistes peruensis]
MSNYDNSNTVRSDTKVPFGNPLTYQSLHRAALATVENLEATAAHEEATIATAPLVAEEGSVVTTPTGLPVAAVMIPMDGLSRGDDSYSSSGRSGDDSYGSSGRETLGSGISGGAGSGNKYTGGVQEPTSLGEDYGSGNTSGESTGRNEPYSGHNEYGSGSVGGAGFGNKSSGGTMGDSSFGGNDDVARNSDPYTEHQEYGSGATGGAGFGNKSSSYDNGGKSKVHSLVEDAREGDRNAAAVDTYRMEVETAALIRAAEDILSLTHVLKEMWLFGKLDTVGTNEAEARAEESAKGVQEGLQKLIGAEKL